MCDAVLPIAVREGSGGSEVFRAFQNLNRTSRAPSGQGRLGSLLELFRTSTHMNRSTFERAALAVLASAILWATPAHSAGHWVAAWSAAPDQAGPPLDSVTLRQIVRVSVGGSRLRIRLSNLYGETPVTIGPVRVAKAGAGSATRLGTGRPVTFGGKSILTLAAGADALSDPIPLPAAALEDLAVSLYLPSGSNKPTLHGVAMQTAFIAAGDATSAATFPTVKTDDSRSFLTDLEVDARADARALIVVGDSITDGVRSTTDANRRWPDVLTLRLQADPTLASIAVINSGIAGNRVLNDASKPFIGPSTLSRFDRDALDKPGVRWVLLLQGGNDISAANVLSTSKDQVSAQQIIDGMRALIARAHARGLKIWGATLLPNESVRGGFWSAAGEEKRLVVNAWIRTSGAFDAVVDFDQVTRDPEHPTRLLPAFDSGDHLHPNDAGYAAMGAAVDLGLFSQRD
jgi:lysophospholipase L1-like esterase